MLVSDFDFDLPEALIAQQPPEVRGSSRLLRMSRENGAVEDRTFAELPEMLAAGDLLVLNDSRVLPARLYATRSGLHAQAQRPTAQVEVLLITQRRPWVWEALVRPGKKVPVGERLMFSDRLQAEVIARGGAGERTLQFDPLDDFYSELERLGHMPLPPYIHRDDAIADRERYQTVFARERGSVAAPTAGLHFTPQVLDALRERGVRIAYVTLHVGLGTFQPVRVDAVEAIRLHTERYTLPAETATEVVSALRENRRVIAVGTTTVRTLEHCAAAGSLQPHSGETNIFISPGFKFCIVGGLLTNFHLPKSTLLMLVSAFAGREPVLAAYAHAVRQGYRFFSYGDCMLLL